MTLNLKSEPLLNKQEEEQHKKDVQLAKLYKLEMMLEKKHRQIIARRHQPASPST